MNEAIPDFMLGFESEREALEADERARLEAEAERRRPLLPPPFTPGVFDDMPAEVYHATEALSQSGATKLLRSPAHYILERSTPKEPTAAMQFGSAVHCGVLEPNEFAARVVCAPDINRRTKDGKAEWAAFIAESAGRIVLDADSFDAARRCVDAVNAHPAARELLAGSRREVSVFWTDERYAVPCKARFDALNHGGIVDIKTTDDASSEAFALSIARWGYHRQAAHYSDGHTVTLGAEPAFFVFVAVERDPPHGVACYAMPYVGIMAGRREMANAKARYAHCLACGEWPGYPPTIDTIALPKWLLRFDN